MSDEQKLRPFAEVMCEYHATSGVFDDRVEEILGDVEYDRWFCDEYDNSIEFKSVSDDLRLTKEQQEFFIAEGFSRAFFCHKDGWETHYTWANQQPCRAWRRRYVSDPNATTTNVVAGPPNPGYFEISYWPEGWSKKEWLETGYMRIVSDPLELA